MGCIETGAAQPGSVWTIRLIVIWDVLKQNLMVVRGEKEMD